MLQRNVDVGTDLFVRSDGFEQLAGDLVWIGGEAGYPANVFDFGQAFEQQSESIFQAKVFAVAGSVLPDEGDFANALLREMLRFGDHGLEAARAELAAQLRNDAERAGMIAALGDLDVSRVLRSGQQARGVLVVKIVGQVGDSAVPAVFREASGGFAGVALRARVEDNE